MKTLTMIRMTIFATLVTQVLFAQDFVDIAKVHYAGSQINNFDDTDTGSRLDEVGLDLTVPFVRNDRLSIVSGLIFEGIKTQLYPGTERETISSLTLKAGISYKHNDKWWGTYLLLPKVASDFKQPLSKKDFQIGGVALIRYNATSNLVYRMGIYGNTELFGPWIVPIVGIYYLNPAKKFEINATLPLAADMNYKITPYYHVGMNFFGLVRSYHLNAIAGGTGTGYVARSTNELFAYLRLNLGKSSIVQLKVGTSLGRSYRVYYEYDKVGLGMPLKYFNDGRQQVNLDFEDGLIGQVVYIYRVPTGGK